MIELKESTLKIYFTSDYSKFRMIGGNRPLISSKINKIKTDINEGFDMLRYCPIIVIERKDGTYDIIDGQHRFYISRHMKRPVFYVIMEKDIELHRVARMNSNTDKWSKKDYINCYSHEGNNEYAALAEFIAKWNIPVSTAVMLLSRGYDMEDSGGRKEKFEEGKFTVNFLEEAETIMKEVVKLDQFKYYKQRAFIIAVAQIVREGLQVEASLAKRLSKRESAQDYIIQMKHYLKRL